MCTTIKLVNYQYSYKFTCNIVAVQMKKYFSSVLSQTKTRANLVQSLLKYYTYKYT